jgi:hypothetical protein
MQCLYIPLNQHVRMFQDTNRNCTYQAILKISHKWWRLREGMECWASILTLTFVAIRTAESSAICTSHTLSPMKFLIIISLTGWVDARATECGQKDYITWKFSRTPTGIRTWDLPSCGAAPRSTAFTPKGYITATNYKHFRVNHLKSTDLNREWSVPHNLFLQGTVFFRTARLIFICATVIMHRAQELKLQLRHTSLLLTFVSPKTLMISTI